MIITAPRVVDGDVVKGVAPCGSTADLARNYPEETQVLPCSVFRGPRF